MLQSLELRLAKILNIQERQVVSTVELLDDGATVPFIARYRKEVTGGLSDTQLRDLAEKLDYLRELDDRRDTILKAISEQGRLTDELEKSIYAADTKTTLEDLYLPYKVKRRTKALIAREAGLEPLALGILANQACTPEVEAENYLNAEKGITSAQLALDGARHILLEVFSENAAVLAKLRQKLWHEGVLKSEVVSGKEESGVKFLDYFNYSENIKTIPSHRALAVLRGVNEGVLSLNLKYQEDGVPSTTISPYEEIILNDFAINTQSNAGAWLAQTVRLCFRAKIFVSLENELINQMRELADVEAIKVFATNLHSLLLQAPAGSHATLGLDPGIRTGVKVAVVDSTSKVLDTAVVYPFQPANKYNEALSTLGALCQKYDIELVSIGNGTASRETEKLVADMQAQYPHLQVTKAVVSEAGASVYSASAYAAKEFPDMDVSLRGAVSIARRLQDPLAELVKIDPKSIGVGQYQHDVNQVKLSNSLTNVVEDCVNAVGVDVNTASAPLLMCVSGLNSVIANNIVSYRDANGGFTSRIQLKKVPRLGDKAYEQCAGFLRIRGGKNVLDSSAVHPESYPLVEEMAASFKVGVKDLMANPELIKQIKATDFVSDGYGLPTIQDVIRELEKPGRDPRGEFKTAKFQDGVNTLDDLTIGMDLEGVVTNITNFGAFVDIGVHQDGLVHISQITDKFIANPSEVLKTGQIVRVKVLEVDKKRKRIALTMKLNQRPSAGAVSSTDSSHRNVANASMAPRVKSIEANKPSGALADAFAKLKMNK